MQKWVEPMPEPRDEGIFVDTWRRSIIAIHSKYPTAQLVSQPHIGHLKIVVDDKIVGFVDIETGAAYLYQACHRAVR